MQLPFLKESKMPRSMPEPTHEGGEPGMDESEELMNHVSKEAIDAVHARDHESFRSALHVMMSDYMDKMSKPESMED